MNKFLAIGLGAAAVVVARLRRRSVLRFAEPADRGADSTPTGRIPPSPRAPSRRSPSRQARPVVWLDGSEAGLPHDHPSSPRLEAPAGISSLSRRTDSDPPDGCSRSWRSRTVTWRGRCPRTHAMPSPPCRTRLPRRLTSSWPLSRLRRGVTHRRRWISRWTAMQGSRSRSTCQIPCPPTAKMTSTARLLIPP